MRKYGSSHKCLDSGTRYCLKVQTAHNVETVYGIAYGQNHHIGVQAELEAAEAEGRAAKELLLSDGRVLKVPIGAEFATDETTGEQYQVKWAQDESGNLDVLSWHPVSAAAAVQQRTADPPATQSQDSAHRLAPLRIEAQQGHDP